MELFFDLAFIFALARLTSRLPDDLTVAGVLRTLLLLSAIWWVWTVTAWSTDWFSPSEPFVRGLLAWVMFGGLLMAAAIPEAFGRHALLFAGTYVAIHLGRGAGLIYALHGHAAQARSARVVVWFAITGVFWIVGAVAAPARQPLWAVAIVVDVTIGLIGYPVPKLGHSTQEQLRVVGEHFAERYEQIFIVAIGEFILVTSISFLDAGFGWPHTVAFALSFVNALLYAQIYHLPAGRGLGPTLDQTRSPGRLALTAGYLHLVLLAGILATAAGNEMIIRNANGPNKDTYTIVLAAGAVLFLLSRVLISLVTYRGLPWPRVAGAGRHARGKAGDDPPATRRGERGGRSRAARDRPHRPGRRTPRRRGQGRIPHVALIHG
jgi:low temperature requirement protein LtrA